MNRPDPHQAFRAGDAMKTAAMDGNEHKLLLALSTLIKDPILWVVSLAFGSLGFLFEPPHVVPWAWMFSAFAGGMIVKLLQFWLRARQQRDVMSEQQAARMERLLGEQQKSHEAEMQRLLAAHSAEVGRLWARIEKLESAHFKAI